MSAIINGSVSLEKIQEAAQGLEQHTNGNTYVPVTIFINDDTKYGNNASIQVSQSKEERERGDSKTYLGNAKVVHISDTGVTLAERPDDVPF